MTSKQLKELLKNYKTHRIGSHSDDWGGESDKPCFCDLETELLTLFSTELNNARKEQIKAIIKKWQEFPDDGEFTNYLHDLEAEAKRTKQRPHLTDERAE